MDQAAIPFEWSRMFFGDEPPLFLLEIAFRTIVIYAYTLFLIRWIGSRSIGQLSLVEFLLVIALGSAVGDAMFYPDVPLVHCMVVITVVVLLDKLLSYVMARHEVFEDLLEGKTVQVVGNGIIDCRMMRKMNVGHDELFEQLRLKEIGQLGEVRAAFFEANGFLSAFKAEDEEITGGLSIFPPWDVAKPKSYHVGDVPEARRYACPQCAAVCETNGKSELVPCKNCGGEIFHAAARTKDRKRAEPARI